MPSGTLRKWEQRYRVVCPQRSSGNYRLYDDEAVRRLSVMRSLVEAGWSPQAAAEHVVDDASAAESQLPRPGEAMATVRGEAMIEALVGCAVDFDVPRLELLLAAAFAESDVATVVDEWLMPSLVRLGRGWQCGELSVAGEHFVTAAVHRRLAHTFQSMPSAAPGGRRVVVGLARGARHELGVLAFCARAALTRGRGDLPRRGPAAGGMGGHGPDGRARRGRPRRSHDRGPARPSGRRPRR